MGFVVYVGYVCVFCDDDNFVGVLLDVGVDGFIGCQFVGQYGFKGGDRLMV